MDLSTLSGLEAHQSADAELALRLAELDKEAAGRPFNAAQEAEFLQAMKDRETLATIIKQLELRTRAVQEAVGGGEQFAEHVGLNFPNVIRQPEDPFDVAAYRKRVGSIDELPKAYSEGARRILESAEFPTSKDPAKSAESVERLIRKHAKDGAVAQRVIATASPAYAEAWAKATFRQPLTSRQQAILQTYSDGTDGGVALPFTIDPTFINTSDGSVNPLRQIARVETITTKSWQGVTTAGVTAAYIGERTTTGASDGAPTDFDDPTATPVRADVAIDVSLEYLQDYGTAALVGEVGTMVQIAKDDLEATKFVMGDGTDEPDGVVAALITDTTSIVPTDTSDVFVLKDIDDLISATPPRFRARGRFMANLAILQLIPPFGSAAQPGNSIYDALSSRLRGYPVHEATAMDDAATDAKEILLFGDFRAGFIIVDRVGVSTKTVDAHDTNGRPTGNSILYASWRNTSKLLFANAFRLLKVA